MQKLITGANKALWYLASSCFFSFRSCSDPPPRPTAHLPYTSHQKRSGAVRLTVLGSLHVHLPLLQYLPSPHMTGSFPLLTPPKSIPGSLLRREGFDVCLSLGRWYCNERCFPSNWNGPEMGRWLAFHSFSICSTLLGM